MTMRHGKRGGENSAEPGSHKTEQSRAHAPLTLKSSVANAVLGGVQFTRFSNLVRPYQQGSEIDFR